MLQTDPPITASCIYPKSLVEVWFAITELAHMKQWYFPMIPDFQTKFGFKTKFIVENEGRVFPHIWEVTEVIPMKKISYLWHYGDAYPGKGLVTWQLTDLGDQTELKLTNDILEDFPDDIPEFKTASCQAGWDYFIGQSLKAYLS